MMFLMMFFLPILQADDAEFKVDKSVCGGDSEMQIYCGKAAGQNNNVLANPEDFIKKESSNPWYAYALIPLLIVLSSAMFYIKKKEKKHAFKKV